MGLCSIFCARVTTVTLVEMLPGVLRTPSLLPATPKPAGTGAACFPVHCHCPRAAHPQLLELCPRRGEGTDTAALAEHGGAAQCQSFSRCLFCRWCAEWVNAAKTPFLKARTTDWRSRWAQSWWKFLRWASRIQPALPGLRLSRGFGAWSSSWGFATPLSAVLSSPFCSQGPCHGCGWFVAID